MPDWAITILGYLSGETALAVARAAIYIVAGMLLARFASRYLARALSHRLDPQQQMLLKRISYYAILVLALVSALRELNFDLTVLLGAAGILTVALGFASQTSASNLISGLFLIGERPFTVGDIITVGQTTGEVLSIDPLSVKLRTFENLLVRVPNESLIKSEIVNLTRFPIRRLDMRIGVAYKEDLGRVREILTRVADGNPLCLEEPRPLFIVLGFADSAVDLQFSVWARREKFLDLRNSMHEEVKKAFDDAGVEIPFPHRTIYTGSVTEPFPVRVVDADTVRDAGPAAE